MALVQQLREEEKEEGREGTTTDKGSEARDALEKAFGMSIQNYVDYVEGSIQIKDRSNGKGGSVAISDAEKELVRTLRSLYL